ncbi:PREDICTED: ankyrin repeat domain-containing protein 13D-like, partial [Charadrius vociferus]|uniref:ankyrin repeat domain-containing protein 13D-like n=1 Tax=Charadrius vociferus TaxID=50402 RepID=UPI00052162FF
GDWKSLEALGLRYCRHWERSTGGSGNLFQASDFYVEMKWEFTSWVPLVSKVCPSDVYRVWKRQRGRRSYIFKGEDEGAVVMEVDHDKQVVYTETPPIVSTHLDTRNIAFERNKSGIWGWRSEKMEVVSGYEAKVYSASNVELVTKTRTEHLSDQDKSRSKGSKTPFHSFLGIAQQHGTHNGVRPRAAASPTNPTAITPEEYFDPHFDLETRNIGRPIEMSSKVQRFKATLWLCEQHPLSLAEQVTPIIDLMAISNAHFAKLRDFITLKLPPGFPVKIGEDGAGVTHILNVAREIDNFFPALFTYMNVRVYDEETAQLLPHWNDTFPFLSRWEKFKGLKFLQWDKIRLNKVRKTEDKPAALPSQGVRDAQQGLVPTPRCPTPCHPAAHPGNADMIQPTLDQLHPNFAADFMDTPDPLN